jgi:hypothetical protein
MGESLCCLARITKVLCPNLGAIRYGLILDKSLTVVCLGSPGGTLDQTGLLSTATAKNKNIGLSKLSPDSTRYRKVAETRGIFSFYTAGRTSFYINIYFNSDDKSRFVF